MIRELVFTHVTPLSIPECIGHFTEPDQLQKWFCTYAEERENGTLALFFGQDHYVYWIVQDKTLSKSLIIKQQMSGLAVGEICETMISVEFEEQGNRTEVRVTQKGEISPEMEEDYRHDWANLVYLGYSRGIP
jgi:hypothetical protein